MLRAVSVKILLNSGRSFVELAVFPKLRRQNQCYMRLLLPLLLLIFLASSCVYYRNYPDERLNHLTDVTFAPHNEDVELFFTGESKPSRDYMRIALVKESSTGYSATPGRLVQVLKKKAQLVGADALIIMGAEDSENIRQVFEDHTINSIPRENMWGIAIRYIDNLQLEDQVVSHLSVETLGDIAMMEGGIVDIDPYGGLDQPVTTKWERFVYLHSLEFLVTQKEGWEFTTATPRQGYQRTHLRRNRLDFNTRARLKVNYLNENHVGSLAIVFLDGIYVNINMVIQYDEEGRISGREWMDDTNKRFVTQRYYNEFGTLVREDFQRQIRGEDLKPFLSVEYHFLSPEELQEKLDKEQVVQVEPE